MNKTIRGAAKAAVAVTAAAAAVLGATGSASATSSQGIIAGQSLNVGDSIVSPSGVYQLILQSDGNLVEYRGSGSGRTACWATGTNGSAAHHASYQSDGNFVLYTQYGTALWSSNSAGTAAISVVIANDGVVLVGQKRITGTC
ncbi:lectin [Kitasatospora griseola]|uniref:lectin n=1 Tax=Kitasatospora griseola TaxID=2064 RepID=UPI0016711C9F|nr:lectin [Kitasatospora griseola]